MGYIGAGPTRFNTADELTVTGDAEFNGNLTVKGTTTTIDSASVQTVDLGDNDKIRLGDGDDLQIYHSGAASFISDQGTGRLKVLATDLSLNNAGDTASYIVCTDGGDVQLYHNGSTKLATTATGVDVTGTVTADGLTFDLADFVNVTAKESLAFTIDSDNNQASRNFTIFNDGATQKLFRAEDTGDISFYEDTGTTAKFFWDASAEALGIGTSSPDKNLHIEAEPPVFRMTNPQSSSSLDLSMGKIEWETLDASAPGVIGYIDVVDSNNFGTTFDMAFATGQSGSATERMRIDASGNVGIGTNSPASDAGLSKVVEIEAATAGFKATATGGSSMEVYSASTASYVDTTTNHPIIFRPNKSEAMRIDSSGNVGIGITPTNTFHVGASGTVTSKYTSTDTGAFSLLQFQNTGSIVFSADHGNAQANSNIVFKRDGATESMRIDTSGGLLINATSANFGEKLKAHSATSYTFNSSRSGTGSEGHIVFQNANGAVGTIFTNGTSTSYNTSSDYRLKENVVTDWDATTRLKQLNPVRFNFISNADTTVDGFLAHEVQSVVPEAITGTHNGMRDEEYEVSAATGDIYTPATEAVLDEDGNEVTPAVAEVIHSTDVEQPEELTEGQQWRETTAAVMGTRSVPDYQGIDQSKLVPLLVKTIQELEARIVALETA
jgi:hypothetical protein